MPSTSSSGKSRLFDPRAAVLLGTILLAGALGESGSDWSKCGDDNSDMISACAFEVDAIGTLMNAALTETGNG
ncbi:MAG: hypothetical protein CML68_22595 [Rhodobacteraceae bacterium]|nr:hypothetical protein [Paracoccaceae bacterium]